MQRIPTLDGWRAVAILLVLFCHIGEMDAAKYGAFGVDIFFGLSGLLITTILLHEARETGSISLGRFYTRRAFRILPAYLTFLLGYTALGMWRSGWEVVSCLLFFRNYAPDSVAGGGSQHLWSLSVEEHFYLLWPGLLVLLGTKRAKEWPARLALLVGFWRMIESQFAEPLFPWAFYRFRTDLRLDALLWGCAVAFMLFDAKARETLRKQLPFAGWVAAAAVVVVSIKYFTPMTSVLVATLIPFLLAGTVLHPEWPVSKVLEFAPMAWLGRISYSLYLWQAIFIFPPAEHPTEWWRQWPVNLVLSIAVATLSYYVVEQPLIRLGRRVAATLDTAPNQDAGHPVIPYGADGETSEARP